VLKSLTASCRTGPDSPRRWPPAGRCPTARCLACIQSSAAHAPYLGEVALLHFLTRTPADGVVLRTEGGYTPRLVWVAYLFFFGLNCLHLFN
jgi:hypothetical protein